jgi:hypothetical protein
LIEPRSPAGGTGILAIHNVVENHGKGRRSILGKGGAVQLERVLRRSGTGQQSADHGKRESIPSRSDHGFPPDDWFEQSNTIALQCNKRNKKGLQPKLEAYGFAPHPEGTRRLAWTASP